jgi:plasmid stabilization system protein ParE
MNYTVRSSRKADTDIAVIFEWIAKRSPDGASRWLDALEAAIHKLRIQAGECALAPEADEIGIDLRQMMFRTRRGRPYRLLFVIRDDVVSLAAVRGAGQDDVLMNDIELPE